jgi:hypothetical protein
MGRAWEKHIQVDERYHWFVKDYYDEHRRLHKVRRPGFCHTLLEVAGLRVAVVKKAGFC